MGRVKQKFLTGYSTFNLLITNGNHNLLTLAVGNSSPTSYGASLTHSPFSYESETYENCYI